ncbi:MAG: hypothetical protein KY475_11625 [Planctomycetes bacterium]|nr:hypothetical protein [Planctomycetota bacterium]
MTRCSICVGLVIFFASLTAAAAVAAIFPQDRGAWPQDWPEELEPLRESSRTLGIGTALQENIYEIPIPDQATFEKVWPAVLRLRSPNGRITLYRAASPPPKMWGDLLSNGQPTIRIYAPTGSYALNKEIDPVQRTDFKKLVEDGQALHAAPPWPDYLVGKNGELPEYVTSVENKEGQLLWKPADPFEARDEGRAGFFNRARIDVDLVIDGEVIDLNKTRLPDGVTVLDRRFEQ